MDFEKPDLVSQVQKWDNWARGAFVGIFLNRLHESVLKYEDVVQCFVQDSSELLLVSFDDIDRFLRVECLIEPWIAGSVIKYQDKGPDRIRIEGLSRLLEHRSALSTDEACLSKESWYDKLGRVFGHAVEQVRPDSRTHYKVCYRLPS